MDKEIQEKLEQGNRARSKKYLDNIKSQGKRQISVILDSATINELVRLKKESIKTGQLLTYGDIITIAINNYVNIDKNITPTDSIKKGKSTVNSNKKVIKKKVNTVSKDTIENVKYDINIDVKDFTHGNAPTNKEIYKIHLDKILKKIKPGQWKKEAEKLNKRGIRTVKGGTWTGDNLRMACKKFKQ